MPMLVKTKLKEVPPKGIGLIADEQILEGQIIYIDIKSFDRVFSGDTVNKMDKLLREFVKVNASYSKERDEYYLCCDNARFWNHSKTPNTKYFPENGTVVALQGISRGEELTADYKEFCDSCKQGDWGFEIF